MRNPGRLNSCIILFLQLLISIPSITSACLAEDAAGKPVLVIQDPNYAFGQVTEGTKVQHDFTILNKGTADLAVQRVVAGCGCTAAAVLNQAIPANTESKVTVTLDTTGLSGEMNKSVRVYSNDTENPIAVITLTGIVQQKVSIEPANILFESITKGQKDQLSKEVKISVDKSSGVKIGDIRSFSKYINISAVSGDDYQKKFTVTLDNSLPLGDFRERIIVSMSGSSKSSINIPVYANVKGFLQLTPPAVSFGIIAGNEKITRKITLDNKSDLSYVLKSVETANKALTAKVTEIVAGKQYAIDLTLDPKKVDTDMRTELKFKADTELDETVSVNAYGVLPPKL